ncbi:uncharacterized protein TNCV_2782561 [Trichonephila clavipes]|nr:uncharacterized protein TNCV_2782561 [Trichonephila clavipes]
MFIRRELKSTKIRIYGQEIKEGIGGEDREKRDVYKKIAEEYQDQTLRTRDKRGNRRSYVNPTPLAHADASRDIFPRGGTSQWRPTRFNLYDPEMRNTRGFNVWPEVYFSGSENVTEFLEGIDNQIKLLEMPSDLLCAYLKGHLMGRALD